jgi:cytochrome c553
MPHRAVVSLLLIFLLSAAAAGFAAETPLVSGDAAAGEARYRQTCIVCHGEGGVGTLPENPILAGQHAEYLAAQLRAYRGGERENPLMTPMANLSDDEIANIAVYLAARPPALSGALDEALARAGENLYRGGDLNRALPACAACHTPAGAGISPLYPRIGGQHAVYTAASLKAFRDGNRKSDVMNAIAKQLSDEEIAALAEYIAGLHP